MLLKDPAILILDEATSHLDSETEALIQEALAAALRGRTSFVVAHRLSTVRAADQIVVLAEGEVVERGWHVDLVGRNGPYADLYETQFELDGRRTARRRPSDEDAQTRTLSTTCSGSRPLARSEPISW